MTILSTVRRGLLCVALLAASPAPGVIPPGKMFTMMPCELQFKVFIDTLRIFSSLGKEAVHYQHWRLPLDGDMPAPVRDNRCGVFDWTFSFLDLKEPPALVRYDHPHFDQFRPEHKRVWGKLDESRKKLTDAERETAQVLLADGWDINAWPEVQNDGRNPEGHAVRRSYFLGDPEFPTFESILVEFKTLDPGADSDTIVKRVLESLRDGGQAPYIVVDLRKAGTSESEALRSAARLRGAIMQKMAKGQDHEWRLFELRLVGNGYDHIADFGTKQTLAARKNRYLDGMVRMPDPPERHRVKKK